ncbi:MAG: copper homeostasis protein CutC [bacterium]|nr:copper homeostasis protein CutC [bacterium]
MASSANAPLALVEVAVDSVDGAVAAAAAGADRLEVCSALEVGGLTPTAGLLAAIRAAVDVPVFAMARPRAGDFCYTEPEFEVLLRDVAELRDRGADGVVTGMLDEHGEIDRGRFEQVQRSAGQLPITCHRAFDLTSDPRRALAALIELGIPRLLTSGQAAAAPDGSELIASLVEAASEDMIVMPGAGVRADNAAALLEATRCREIHLSATTWQPSPMQFRRDGVSMGVTLPGDEYQVRRTDGDVVRAVIAALSSTP